MDKQEIYFPQKLQLKVEILPPISVLGLYTVKPQTCDRQVFKKDGTNDCLEADGGGLTLKACKVLAWDEKDYIKRDVKSSCPKGVISTTN